MVLSLLLFLLHAYIGVRLIPGLPAPAKIAYAIALLGLFALLVATARAMFSRRQASRVLIWSGFTALGFFSSLLVLTLLRDAFWLFAVAARLAGWELLPEGFVRTTAVALPALALAASLVGFINARRLPAVREIEVPINGLDAALDGFSIAQISDLHVGPTIRRGFVQAVVDTVNGLKPDLVVITGDVVDGRVAVLNEHTAPLGQLQSRHGTLAITGNHEYYSGVDEWIAEFRRLGMKVLMNEHVRIAHNGTPLVVGGVPDYSAGHFDPSHRSDPERALAGAPREASTRLLLAHQPRSAIAAEPAGYDLQISGHTHGGQFLPWNWFVPLQQPYTAGLRRHGRMWVYVSRGTGYWGPPMRLGAPSEITRLRLVRAP